MQVDQISVSAIAGGALTLIGKIIFDWLKNKRNGNGNMKNVNLEKMAGNIKWLKDIHNRYDENGSPMWFFPRAMKETLDHIDQKSTETNLLLRQILEALKK